MNTLRYFEVHFQQQLWNSDLGWCFIAEDRRKSCHVNCVNLWKSAKKTKKQKQKQKKQKTNHHPMCANCKVK